MSLPTQSLHRRRGRAQHLRGRTPLAGRGRRTGSLPHYSGQPLRFLDLSATLSAAVRRQQAAGIPALPVQPRPGDWYRPRFEQRPHRLVLFVVDASDSMGDGPEQRMSAALGAAVALAGRAYLNRDQVALITFRDRAATLVVPPTGSVQRVRDRLRRLAVGGATPLADALHLAHRTIGQARRKDPLLDPILILISDGEATVPLLRDGDPAADSLAAARLLREEGIPCVLVDTGSQPAGRSLLPHLATALGGHRRRLHELTPHDILQLLETERPVPSHD